MLTSCRNDDNDAQALSSPPLFDWYGNGDVTWAFEGADDECRTTQASADFMRSLAGSPLATVVGCRRPIA